MGLAGLGSVLSYLRTVTPAGQDGDDALLLARFAAGDEQAFEVLVRRHAALVWGVCHRVLGRPADAEDAFQATFLVLFRKAGLLGHGPLGPWLHRVAWRTAARARVRAARLASREAAVAREDVGVAGELPDDGLRELLDEEVGRLPEKYRVPVVLCYLEGLSNEQAADRLGCPRGTVLSRLSRAREQLRRRLERRGVGLPTVVPVAAVPAALVEAVVRAAPAFRAGSLSTPVLTLAEGVLFGMSLHKLRLFALALVTLAGLTGAGLWASKPASAPPAAARAAPAPAGKDDRKAAVAKPADKKGKEPEKPVSRAQEIRDLLRQEIDFGGLDDPKTTLREVLDSLAKRPGLRFDVNERAFKADGLSDVLQTEIANPAIPGMKAPLSTVLRKILERLPNPSGATFVIRKSHIRITTEDALRPDLGLPPAKRDKDGLVTEALGPLVWEEFSKVSLEKALRDIADATDVNVVLDARVEDKGAIKVTARLHNVPVDNAVEVLADMGGLTVVHRGNILYVTSPENAQKLQKERGWSKEAQRAPRPVLRDPAGGGM
jgi:RNA polymerase sigma factor (sigma-70 family)